MTLQTIIHGEPNWDAKVNDLIASVNGQDDKLEQLEASKLKVSNWIGEGFVFQNGFANYNGQSAYRVVTFSSGQKLVELSIKSTLNTTQNGFGGRDWVVLPAAAAPGSWQLSGTINGAYFYTSNANTLGMSKTTGGDWQTGGYQYNIHTMYFVA